MESESSMNIVVHRTIFLYPCKVLGKVLKCKGADEREICLDTEKKSNWGVELE